MERKSIAQEYYTLMIDKNGLVPAMRKDESRVGLLTAGFVDLLLNDIVTVEKKKITVCGELPKELMHLEELYAYLKEKKRTTEKMISDFYLGMSNKKLVTMVGQSLVSAGVAKEAKGTLFAPKVIYIPETGYKEELTGIVKKAVRDRAKAPHDAALIYLLQETKNLNQYLSKYEREQAKEQLKELKSDPQNKQLAEILHYISDTIEFLMVVAMVVLS